MAKRKRAKKPKGRLYRQARAYGKLQIAPELANLRSEGRAAKRQRRAELQSSEWMGGQLQSAISQAIADTKATPGLTERDLAMALGELARRRVDAASGTALRAQDIERRFQDTRSEQLAQKKELRGRQGIATAERLDELVQRKKDRSLEKKNLKLEAQGVKLDKQRLGLEERQFAEEQRQNRFDRYIAQEELDIKRLEAKAELQDSESAKLRKEIKESFNEALASVRAAKTPKDKPMTPAYAREHRGELLNTVAASTPIKGNRVLARAVVEKYLNEVPSESVRNYMRRNRVNLFPEWARRRRDILNSPRHR